METRYQARWVSKARMESLRKHGHGNDGVLIDSFNGFLVVEPAGSNLGDGHVLSPMEADYELRPVWSLSSRVKLVQARKLLGLEANPPLSNSP